MIPVVWLNFNNDAPNRGYWDQGLLERLVSGELWTTGQYEYQSHDGILPDISGAVLIIPGRQNAEHFSKVQNVLDHLDWAVVIITGDEENEFPGEDLKHPRMRLWAMTPQPGRYLSASNLLGSGTPPGMNDTLNGTLAVRENNWFFAGQITHSRREDCAAVLRGRERGLLVETPGFTQGLPQEKYWVELARAKLAPAPGGPVHPDSFRLFEALEAGCVPIADRYSGHHRLEDRQYWDRIFGDVAFPRVDEWTDFPALHSDLLRDWPGNANVIFSWWQQYKRNLAYKLDNDVNEVSGIPFNDSPRITVLIPTSPIPSNPETTLITETLFSIRERLPDAEIIIMCDGVRDEQLDKKPAYEQYLQQLTWQCNHSHNVLPLVFTEHLHQGAMTRLALDAVRTSQVLFVEHDTPLVGYIPWSGLSEVIASGQANVIRLHHEASILEPHRHMMLAQNSRTVAGIPLMPTIQWSQRPHLASTSWYRWMTSTYFATTSRTMIEDLIYGVLETYYREDGHEGWEKFRLFIYAPEGDMKRSTHLDGRGGEPKYSMLFDYEGEVPPWAPHRGVRDE